MPPVSFTRAIDPRRTLLLICDVQSKFRVPIYGFSEMCLAIRKMTKAAAILEMPVMATEQNPLETGMGELPPHLLLGVHPKTKFSMCIPPIQAKIKERGIDSAIIVGIESTLDLLASDIRVFVLADAVSSVNKDEIPIALDVMKQAGAVITTSESVMFRLMRDASQPQFKPFVQLVKEESGNGSTKRALSLLGGKS